MNAQDKFTRLYHSLPEKAKTELVYYGNPHHPMTLRVVWLEVSRNTELGRKIIHYLGFEDD